MAKSATAAVAEWVHNQAPGSWLWARDAPAPPHIALPVLSRLAKDASLDFVRFARGFYWKGYPAGHDYHRAWPDHILGALIYAGPGAGLRGWSALNTLGWSYQIPAGHQVSVLARRLKPPHASVDYVTDYNRRRECLTWGEVTVLEAVKMLDYVEEAEPWERHLRKLVNGTFASRAGWETRMRTGAILWAGAAEGAPTCDRWERVEEIASVLVDSSGADAA